MANALYGKGREAFANGSINWPTDTIRIQLVDAADYAVSIDSHQFFSSITVAGRVGSATAIANKTNTLGVCDGDDTVISAVTGDPSEAIIIYKDTGVEGTSPLIAYIDVATGLPVTPNGSNITVTWDSGANKIFKL